MALDPAQVAVDRRLELQSLLEETLGGEERDNVYFQPPPNIQMKYPAIVYARDSTDTTHANNLPYTRTRRYQVTVISTNVDTDIVEKVGALPMCSHVRFFARNDLNHDVFTLYF